MKLPLEAVCGIIGDKLSHSITPKLLNHLAVTYGLDHRFRPIELSPEGLEPFMLELRERSHVCLNVTSPFKQVVVKYLDALSGDASDAGAVNIIRKENGILKGYNSDIEGFQSQGSFIAEIKEVNQAHGLNPVAMILGSGGAAMAAAVGLTRNWGEGTLIFMGRNIERVENNVGSLRDRFEGSGMEYIVAPSWDDARPSIRKDKRGRNLLINSTPIGQWPDAGDEPFRAFGLTDNNLVDFKYYYDAVYNPAVTKAMKHLSSIGLKTVGGVDWFCRQAVRSAELFLNINPPEEEVRRFVGSELG